MTTQPIENPPAFPTAGYELCQPVGRSAEIGSAFDLHSESPHPGMTLRDYLAAKAMQGILANAANYGQGGILESGQPAIAQAAYELADAMLAARAKVAQ